jgi:hypothetical protein
MIIYALFYCFVSAPQVPCVQAQGPFDSVEACEEMKGRYQAVDMATGRRVDPPGIKYICMKKTVPTWEPAH